MVQRMKPESASQFELLSALNQVLGLLVSRVKRLDNLIDGILAYSRVGRSWLATIINPSDDD